MMHVGISDTIRNRMLDGPVVADPSRGAVALEGSAPMTLTRTATVELHRRDGSIAAIALIDAEDLESVSMWRWHLSNGYAARGVWCKEIGTSRRGHVVEIFLHRFLMDCVPGDGTYVDHVNRDRLDDRRANLRVLTPQQSRQNMTAPGGSSRFRGVSFNKRESMWRAKAGLNGRTYNLGRYTTEHEAAEAARAWRIAHMPFAVEDSCELRGGR